MARREEITTPRRTPLISEVVPGVGGAHGVVIVRPMLASVTQPVPVHGWCFELCAESEKGR